MPPLRQEGSLLNEASFRDLAEVADGHRQQLHHDFSPDADRWRALLVAAAEQDVYTTANVRTPDKRGGGLLSSDSTVPGVFISWRCGASAN